MIPISKLQIYNKSDTIDHIKSLAFNRNATSTGETEALMYIKNVLMKENIEPKVEYFSWTGPMRVLMRLAYVIVLTYFILFRLFLVIIAYFILKNFFEKTRSLTLVNKEESKNLYTKILAKDQAPDRPVIIFSAHYDSISVHISYKFQVLIFSLYKFIIFFYFLIAVSFSAIFFLDYFDFISISDFVFLLINLTSLIGIFASIPILFLVFIASPSSGSIDNASGVSILIELAKLLKKNPLNNIDVLLIWTGAEEWGMKGSKKFCKMNFKGLKNDYDLNRSYNINIDMVGSYIGLLNKTGIVKRKINRNLNDTFEETANKLKIPLISFNKFFKPKSDYKIFKKYSRRSRKKLQVSCFISDKDSKFIHSLKDTPDKCSIENLNGCLNICHHAIRNLDLRAEKI